MAHKKKKLFHQRKTAIALCLQASNLRAYFPQADMSKNGEVELKWTCPVTPSPLSASYTLHLHYRRGKAAKVYVLEPKPLALASGQQSLPHVYNHAEQQLCLYYPKYKEFTLDMLFVNTLIPWACEWLLHYEIWVATGAWRGGGIEHTITKEAPEEEI